MASRKMEVLLARNAEYVVVMSDDMFVMIDLFSQAHVLHARNARCKTNRASASHRVCI